MQIIYMKKKVESIFKFIQAFKSWEAKNPLTPIQEKLLLRIMFRVNENHWEEWTPISNGELILEMRVHKPTFIRNRDHLKSLGILRYKKGSKGRRSFFGLNMPIAETTYVFPENENKVSPEIPEMLPENENKVSPEIPKTVPKTVPNESETPHEQCVSDTPKHINNKSIIRNINITHNTTIAQSDKITHELMSDVEEKIFIEIPLVGDKVYRMPEKLVEEYQKLYTGIDVRQQIRKYKAWAISNPKRRKTERGILKSINSWLGKNQDKNLFGGLTRDREGGEYKDAWQQAWNRQHHEEDGTCTRYSEGD